MTACRNGLSSEHAWEGLLEQPGWSLCRKVHGQERFSAHDTCFLAPNTPAGSG